MAGRLLPIALATVSGIAIGVATFDGELKEQRKKKLEEEYNHEAAAASALNSEGPSLMASSAIKPPTPEQLPATTETAKTSKLSSLLGFWAWKPRNSAMDAASSPPPSKPITQSVQDPQQPPPKS
ncbi:hypothetical protein CC80DRAFT_542276 [Byssothecium circinans]|uniref:Uncharacterized protein n=1 Tax=Byssothecium circinans TaxID=147558 RepID=A0A6A5UEJ8_9PLEO|nr:hypothetical protein CC80DRAFT_542276 [Byssothecium circinans]